MQWVKGYSFGGYLSGFKCLCLGSRVVFELGLEGGEGGCFVRFR